MKLGFFGGSFNPIHMGHLSTAYQVYKNFFLNRVYFIPSGIPTHKKTSNLRNLNYRLSTICKSLPSIFFLKTSKVELNRQGKTYTIDTIFYFNSLLKKKYKIYLILGTDAFFEIHMWKKYKILLEKVKIIIVSRHFINSSKKTSLLKGIDKYIKWKLFPKYNFFFTKIIG